ncbi:MAG: glycogen-binding domain-containing protein [Elusimicrobia bacterium]|nr:glycogen-binding domain-containing protein [Elusimicrobiota bacterium]
MERKSMLLLLAAVVFALVSVPSVLFNNAIKKYFSFVGQWNVATVKPTRTVSMPLMHPRPDRPVEAPQPELRFVRFDIKIAGAKDVRIAGDFNKWNPDSLVLVKKDAKTWEAMLPLPPGRYKYICRIDGQEVLDPLNPDTDTEGGRKVSVITVK